MAGRQALDSLSVRSVHIINCRNEKLGLEDDVIRTGPLDVSYYYFEQQVWLFFNLLIH